MGFRLTRRHLLKSAGAMGILTGLEGLAPAYAWEGITQRAAQLPRQPGAAIDLEIAQRSIPIGGRHGAATTINGSVPGPLLRLKEGETVTIKVTNQLEEDASIHWHGVLLPAGMDGVPKVSFPGIKPRETFTYQFPIKQYGTYWYHSHSSLQEQTGVYGPLILTPRDPEPFQSDRDYVVMLSDWTFEDPHRLMARLKKQNDYYNFQRRTVGEFVDDVRDNGLKKTVTDRLAWGRMRMAPTDILDVTGASYTYLVNGLPPEGNWTALFRKGERVRLRFINGSAMSIFDVRIPNLKMTVVLADGQYVSPVSVDEFRISTAETYDVIVQPDEERAYTVFAEVMDRSGYARGTLAPREGMSAEIPPRRPRPLRTMTDMGMSMQGASMPGMEMPGMDMSGKAPVAAHDATSTSRAGMDKGLGAGNAPVAHGPDTHGPGNSVIPMVTKSRLDEPGDGLGNDDRRVLVYTDLRDLEPFYDQREPGREIELHLTGNMEHFIWGFDGKKFSEVRQIAFRHGERLRLTMVNDTMMDHPIHLHGMWMVLENGAGAHDPRKHTVNVKPAERLSVLISADAEGHWAFHCHLLYHMEMGMFRVIDVSAQTTEAR